MGRLVELDAVVEVLENAFHPLACTVPVSSAKQSESFVIFNSAGAVILRAVRKDELEMRDPYSLRKIRCVIFRMEELRMDLWVPPRETRED